MDFKRTFSSNELIVHTTKMAHGGHAIAYHEGKVIFVRYALPDEDVRVRLRTLKNSYGHADCLEVLTPSPYRIDSLCPIAGVEGAGCCDMAFIDPPTATILKTQVLADQLNHLAHYHWNGQVQRFGNGCPTGWRTRIKLSYRSDHTVGFHRYHSNDIIEGVHCAQIPSVLSHTLTQLDYPPNYTIYAGLGDDGLPHVLAAAPQKPAIVLAGTGIVSHHVDHYHWQIPLTVFWQAHKDAPQSYTNLVRHWLPEIPGATAWDLYGGVGLFAPSLAQLVGDTGRVISVDTSKQATFVARHTCQNLPQIRIKTTSVARMLAYQHHSAHFAILDPPRNGAGRQVIELLARHQVKDILHFGCDIAAFARDIGLYRRYGYHIEEITAFDAFPLTHHVECVAFLHHCS